MVMSLTPAAEMQRIAQRLNALDATIMPNSNSLSSALLPDARCADDTIGIFFGTGVEASPDAAFFFDVSMIFFREFVSLDLEIVMVFYAFPADI
jgi:hypothetical protein